MSASAPRQQDRSPSATAVAACISALAIALLIGCSKPISSPSAGGMPSLPSPPSPSSSGLPSPPSLPSLPSPSSSGLPSPPSLPSPSSSGLPSPPSLPSPSSGVPSSQSPDAEQRKAGRDAAQTARSNKPANGTEPAQNGDAAGQDDWEVSTELPDVAAGDASREGDESERSSGAEDGADGEDVASAGVPGSDQQSPDAEEEDGGDTELERALDDLDGGILDKRIAAQDRAKDPREQAGSRSRTDEEDEATQTDASNDDGSPGRQIIASTVPDTPPLPSPETPDMPDARDEDVVARQLREAAMAEKNPQLRAALWEEYERYVSGLGGRKAKKAKRTSNYAPPEGRPIVHFGR